LEALRKRQKFYADRETQPSRVFAKGDKRLVEERKENGIQELERSLQIVHVPYEHLENEIYF
jgi:hypothetical protein